MSRLTRSLAVVPLAAALSLALVAPASAAQDRPDQIPLRTGSMPEGISAGPGDTFFAGARSDGAVYVGSTRTGKVRQLVAPRQGEVAVGLLYDSTTKRLWVAGGGTGDLTAYDARSGKLLFTVNTGTGRFVNDVALTRDAVYFTDSTRAELLVVRTPGGALPRTPAVSTVPLTGDYVQPAGFGANGIRALPTGDLLLVSGGALYEVTPAGAADVVEQSGRQLTAGDGLVLDGTTLYVVYGFDGRDSVAELELSPDFEAATFVREIGEEATTSDLDRPTTGALVGGDLYVVNGRFGTLPGNPNAPVYVSRLDL